ncbi:fluoride efflux transporter family protein [Corynebacterium breve]|uniref:Fluoride-specific ion channel FluC n=1 Tax=Corynebacterium breve TaxID=3049799 RepID=A0ABY8VG80_9CORY|nr:fluoride efflux transporter family protein [Corynebacterium breve]WIM67278.1 fluoride efflux transporter family protein [Corynebacterium breve]
MINAQAKEGLLVGAGAALGALARYGLSLFSAPLIDDLWATLTINILGCFAMGLLRPGAFWGTGVLGGFTTFSAMALVASQSSAPSAASIVILTFVACTGAFLLGDEAYRRGRTL